MISCPLVEVIRGRASRRCRAVQGCTGSALGPEVRDRPTFNQSNWPTLPALQTFDPFDLILSRVGAYVTSMSEFELSDLQLGLHSRRQFLLRVGGLAALAAMYPHGVFGRRRW